MLVLFSFLYSILKYKKYVIKMQNYSSSNGKSINNYNDHINVCLK